MIEDDHAVSGLLDVDLGVIGAHLDGLLDRASAVFGGNLGEPLVSRHDHVPGCTKPLEHADAQAHEYDQRSQSSRASSSAGAMRSRAHRAPWSVSMGAHASHISIPNFWNYTNLRGHLETARFPSLALTNLQRISLIRTNRAFRPS